MKEITKGVNVLSISSDMSIIKEGSDANKRMKEYGTLANRLDIAIYNGKFFGKTDEVYAVSSNVFAYPRSFMGLLSLFRVNSRKLSFVLSHRIDLITAQDPFYLGYIGLRLARWLRAGFQVQIHTDLFSPYFRRESLKNRLKLWIARRVIKKADGIRVVSLRIKESLKKELKINIEPFVLPVWVPISSIKDSVIKSDLKKKYPQFSSIFLMASRITIEKNIKMTLKVMRDIVKRFSGAGLVIVGEGPLKNDIVSMSKSYGLENNVVFEDWTDDLPSYYKTADLFINSSNYEGYGRTIIEAISAGIPVVTTDVGISGEIIKNNENGFIIPVKGRKELGSFLVDFLGDDDFRNKLKAGAKNTDIKYKTKEEYLEMYARSWSECIK